jgi:hypothetical protein
MTTKPNAATFLKNMQQGTAGEGAAPKRPEAPTKAATDILAPAIAKPASVVRRSSLKHIGGYFDSETVEKVALLRARLDLDNSELIKLAIDELFTKQKAARAFGN